MTSLGSYGLVAHIVLAAACFLSGPSSSGMVRLALFLFLAIVREALQGRFGGKDTFALPRRAANAGSAWVLGCLARLRFNLASPGSDGLTPLHLATSLGHFEAVRVLIGARVNVHATDLSGHTPLAMAAAFGHANLLHELLRASADPNAANIGGGTPLHFASARGDASAVQKLLSSGAGPNIADGGGMTPLFTVVCEAQKADMVATVETLLAGRADPNIGTSKTGQTALMRAAFVHSPGAVQSLMRAGATVDYCDSFGQTALHVACREKSFEAADSIIDGSSGEVLLSQDNDGQYAVTLLCEHLACGDAGACRVLGRMLRKDPRLANARDFGDTTPLITLLSAAKRHGDDKNALDAVQLLVTAKADVTLEEESGWSAAHYASSEAVREALDAPASFWAGFDADKPRDDSNSKYLARRGGHHRIPLLDRQDVLRGDWTVTGIARRIAEGRSVSIVLLFGAGVSTSAGIPDFRSSTGLWVNDTARNLFSPEIWSSDSTSAWRLLTGLLRGTEANAASLDGKQRPQPCSAHRFAYLLEQRKLLLRCYTQNVDGLEREAGVSKDRLVQCHGDATQAICTACPWKAEQSAEVLGCGAPDKDAPTCPSCGSPLRPAIVCFGESLPACYEKSATADLSQCDLLIVAGTSLCVYPVASLLKQVGPLCPRLLVNRDRVGLWQTSESPSENNLQYRDACWEGDVDKGFLELAKLLGWQKEMIDP